jgi:hypothetical protein
LGRRLGDAAVQANPDTARPTDATVDVLIIGAGASGAAVAWSLDETRMKILCLEQGDWIKPTEFPTNGRDWEARRYADFDISPNRRARDTDYPINDAIARFNGSMPFLAITFSDMRTFAPITMSAFSAMAFAAEPTSAMSMFVSSATGKDASPALAMCIKAQRRVRVCATMKRRNPAKLLAPASPADTQVVVH